MPDTIYVSLLELNVLQTDIMKFISWWVHEKKVPVPLKEIIASMTSKGIKSPTTIKSINVLLKKGYIRRAVIISNKTFFVMLRSV